MKRNSVDFKKCCEVGRFPLHYLLWGCARLYVLGIFHTVCFTFSKHTKYVPNTSHNCLFVFWGVKKTVFLYLKVTVSVKSFARTVHIVPGKVLAGTVTIVQRSTTVPDMYLVLTVSTFSDK